MSIELLLLFWSVTLLAAYIGAQSIPYRLDLGVIYASSARDDGKVPGVFAERGARALRNFLETWGAFIALCVVAELTRTSNLWTGLGAHLWFWSRWVYLPLYVFGVPFIRSLVWLVSALGLALMFLGLLPVFWFA